MLSIVGIDVGWFLDGNLRNSWYYEYFVQTWILSVWFQFGKFCYEIMKIKSKQVLICNYPYQWNFNSCVLLVWPKLHVGIHCIQYIGNIFMYKFFGSRVFLIWFNIHFRSFRLHEGMRQKWICVRLFYASVMDRIGF